MPIWKYSGFGSSLLAFLMGTVMPVGSAQAQSAGTVGAVNKDATGTPPGRPAQPLEIGRSVVQNEQIQTNANGTAHIIFNDRSALNIGRNSTVVIDNFVYNPNAGAGSQTLSLSRGAARFVGGQVSHTSGVNVRTPVVTIGVRGGNITVLQRVQNGQAASVVMVHNGIARLTNALGTQSVRTGYQLIVVRGVPMGEPTRIDVALLREATRQLTSTGAQTGGAIRRPNDSEAARNQIGTPRAPVRTPSFDLPAAGDDLVRSLTTTKNQPPSPPNPDVYGP